jgi:Mn2+/Fe2+ NRAMP family transporter
MRAPVAAAPVWTKVFRPEPVEDGTELRSRDQRKVERLRTQRSLWARLALLFVLVGPGILVMVADNDAGGVMTYAQTGAAYGIGFFLPFLVLMGPVAYFVQEMTVRLGSVTGRGHAELIWQRYGSFWGAFSLVDLLLANVLTLVTEFIGITTGMAVFGVPPAVSSLAGFLLVTTVLLFLRYYTWERVALAIAAGNLVFVPLALGAHPHWQALGRAFLSAALPGGLTPVLVYVLLANLGTTIAPWMLFFQQSSVVDKGLTHHDIRHGQWDTALGSLAMTVVALAIVVLTGTWVHASGAPSFDIHGILAAIAITASTSWAMGEALRWPASINLPPARAWRFYLPGLLSAAVAAGVVLIPHAPLGWLNLTVQVIATIFMPSALFFLLLLVNDHELMGPYANRPWQNVVATVIVLGLVAANALYGLLTVFPGLRL